MTFRDDIQSDIEEVFYDVDEFSESATWFSYATGITSQSFAGNIGEAIFHGDEETGIINRPSITLSSPIANIENVKKRDIITSGGVEYEAVGDTYIDSKLEFVGIINLRRKIETRI